MSLKIAYYEQKLKEAARDGNFSEAIIAMEAHGVDPAVSNNAPLRFAIMGIDSQWSDKETSRYSLIKALLLRGADVRANDGMPASHAIISGNLKLLNILLEHDPSIAKDDTTIKALSKSMSSRDDLILIINALLECGVTPDTILLRNDRLKPFIIDHLVQHGGDLTVNEGRHANAYFSYIDVPPYALFDRFEKKYHPLIVHFINHSL